MRYPRLHLYHPPTLTALDHLQVGEASVDTMPHLRKASSGSLARRTVRLSEDGGEEVLVAFVSIAHEHQILRRVDPLSGGLHKLSDERLVPPSHDEADQKADRGNYGGRFPQWRRP